MAVIATWKGKSFEVSAERINSFEKFTMGLDLETKTKKSGKQQYKTRKEVKPRTLAMDVVFHRLLGVDVEAECLDWIRMAARGESAGFYIGGRLMGPCKFMLTSAKVTESRFAPDTHMTYAKMTLQWEQSSKNLKSTQGARDAQAVNVLNAARAQSKSLRML